MIRTLFKQIFPQVVPLLIFLLVWEFCSLFFGRDKFPHLIEILSTIVSSFLSNPIIKAQGGGDLGYLPHIVSTFSNFLMGFLIGGLLGFCFAIWIFQYSIIQGLFEPVLEMFRAVPPLIMVPFALLIFGATVMAQMLIVALYSSYSICVYTLNALHNIERNYISIADLYGSTRLQKIWTVQIPAVMPELVGALRVTSALSLGIVVVAEYLGSPSGIGRVLKFAMSYTSIDLIIVGIFWVVIMAILVDGLIVAIFRFLLRWSTRSS